MRRKPLVLAVLAALAAALWLASRASGPRPSPRPPPAAPDRPAGGHPADGFALASGLWLPVPGGYGVQARPSDLDPDLEVVLLYPLGASSEALWRDPARLSRGAIVVEAVPLSAEERADAGLRERLERDFQALASKEGWKVSTTRRSDLALPATLFKVARPAHARAFLYADGFVYKFRASSAALRLEAILSGVRSRR